jgi:hydroxymethylbilane synthase
VTLRLATRGSVLAMAQAKEVAELLGGAEIVECSSDGEPGDKARFVRGVEQALLDGRADIGVHSAKDLPAELPEGLAIAGAPPREAPHDAWVGTAASLDEVPAGARIGTASLRRRAQLLAARPDLVVEELHGNVDTRLRRLQDGNFEGIVLAAAGLRRLGREADVSFAFGREQMTPAAGQGILVLEARPSDEAAEVAAKASDARALTELTAERAVVAALDASCATPIGVNASLDDGELALVAFVGLPDGSEWIRDRIEGDAGDPAGLGRTIGERLLAAGAGELLRRAGGL